MVGIFDRSHTHSPGTPKPYVVVLIRRVVVVPIRNASVVRVVVEAPAAQHAVGIYTARSRFFRSQAPS